MRLAYIATLGFLFSSLLFFGCSEEVAIDEEQKKEPIVYLAVTRAHVDGKESINEDTEDNEDRVHDLALLVFESKENGKLVGEKFDDGIEETKTLETFQVKLTPGQRDFYFVANMPKLVLANIQNKADMDTYMKSLKALSTELYKGAKKNEGFPMSRVYPNQEVTVGGTIYQPSLFKPVVNGNPEERVKLIRAVAKLEIELDDKLKGKISAIEYYNANQKYNLSSPTAIESYYEISGGGVALIPDASGSTYRFYMPEAIMPTPRPTWSDVQSSTNKPINYFKIRFNTGAESYSIPVISNGPENNGKGYLPFAKGENADYNILRNHYYKYKITKTSNGIEVLYDVLPWNLVKKTLYMGYWFNIETGDDGSVKIINTIDDCLPHKVTLKALNNAYFDGDPSKDEITYGYGTEAELGLDAEKMKEGYFEEYKINADAVDANKKYLEVYYNGDLVKTYTK